MRCSGSTKKTLHLENLVKSFWLLNCVLTDSLKCCRQLYTNLCKKVYSNICKQIYSNLVHRAVPQTFIKNHINMMFLFLGLWGRGVNFIVFLYCFHLIFYLIIFCEHFFLNIQIRSRRAQEC